MMTVRQLFNVYVCSKFWHCHVVQSVLLFLYSDDVGKGRHGGVIEMITFIDKLTLVFHRNIHTLASNMPINFFFFGVQFRFCLQFWDKSC